jgi:hypothetical protein
MPAREMGRPATLFIIHVESGHATTWSMIPAMATIDPEQERRRLADFYASQTDGELENVAAQVHDLTEPAREALRAELAKRALYSGQLDDSTAAPEPDAAEFRDLVTIRTFWNLLEAQLAKGLLDAAGIECFLFDDNMIRMDWFVASALGGMRLRVDAQNADEATRILEESALQEEDEDGVGNGGDPELPA